MERPVLSRQTPTEYFKELVEEALTTRQVQAAGHTEFYLVNLLCRFIHADRSNEHVDDEELLTVRLGRALESHGAEQRSRLRSLGDFSLFMSGFFSDRFRRSLVDVDYYRSMGEYAYGSLSRSAGDRSAEMFGELARKFVGFMDVLSHVSERTGITSSEVDLLRLYERWLRTGSVRDSQRLISRGVLPNAALGKRSVQ